MSNEKSSNIGEEMKIENSSDFVQDDLEPINSNICASSGSININNNNNNNINNDPNQNDNINDANNNIIVNLSNNQQNISNCDISSISLIEYSDLHDSFSNILKEIEKGELNFEINEKINKGLIPFFIDLGDKKPQLIYAKKNTMFLDVLIHIGEKLNNKDILNLIYFHKEKDNIIDYDKTIGDLKIGPLDVIGAIK